MAYLFGNRSITENDCDFGAIIGLVDLVNCITPFQITDETRQWFNGPFGYVLANPRLLKIPITVEPSKGAVTWWNLTDEKLHEVLKQIKHETIIPITNAEPSEEEKYIRIIRTQLHKPIGALIKLVGEEPLTMQDCLDSLDDYIFDHKIKINQKAKAFIADELLFEIFQRKEIPGNQVIDLLWNHLEEIK